MAMLNPWTCVLIAVLLVLNSAQGQESAQQEAWPRSSVRSVYENAIVFLEVEEGSAATGFKTISTGTGFVVSEDGYVLTNNHVIAGALTSIPGRILATPRSRHSVGDREELRVIATDAERDLSLLQFKDVGKTRTAVVIGNSNNSSLDEEVYAFGFPFEEDLIGATGSITSNTGDQGRWRTDLALNPGNSGGPVFNTQGEVIGIVVSKNRDATLISHFIPINFARDLLIGHGVEIKQEHSALQQSDSVNIVDRRWSCLPGVDVTICLNDKLSDALGPSVSWDRLKYATEFGSDDVKYYGIDASAYMAKEWDTCLSADDQVVFLFGDDHRLSRYSMRFYHNGDECTENPVQLSYFAETVGAVIEDRDRGRFFDAQGSDVYMMGWRDNAITVVDVSSRGSPALTAENWIGFIKTRLSSEPLTQQVFVTFIKNLLEAARAN